MPMQQKSTFNDLILFAFNETQLSETVRIRKDIETSSETHAQFQHVVETLHGVQRAVVTPSERVLQKILRYANG